MYYKATLFNPGDGQDIPMDMTDTEIVYLEAADPADLLIVAMDTKAKPVKVYEEVTKEVYEANK